ncbi:GGDEF domain-containing protein [Rhodopirellula sp. MGV]|uniref:GGDEF domain-containing protein n=1 Tax=Rhodopirellula sp. MGV TaxID=2023130 RepID=UPI000B974613|nr:GGDEF domain-containing protein [Rhodopirellula sp. MGV]OYP31063.1 GGDEF domain-containing protein [Rhodopirellula sp. MGV]
MLAEPNCRPASAIPEAENTLAHSRGRLRSNAGNDKTCLVQIYPPNVVDGMLLLEQPKILVGRDTNANLVLADQSVSRSHAELEWTDDGYVLRDLGSTNGTQVNDASVQSRLLQSGDTIHFGIFIFRFLTADSIETQYHETVYNALVRDVLTGTMNKRYLLEVMEREIARAVRQQSLLSVTMLDIDHFKSINDTYGHLIGDEVLKQFGGRVANVSRCDDLLARYGGEEFCLLMAGTDLAEACEIAERCRQVVANTPFQTEVGPLDISASFGVACLDPVRAISTLDFLQLADQKLYDAKSAGRNCVCS